jgi:hypothetical protein
MIEKHIRCADLVGKTIDIHSHSRWRAEQNANVETGTEVVEDPLHVGLENGFQRTFGGHDADIIAWDCSNVHVFN